MRRPCIVLVALAAAWWLACGDSYGTDAPPAPGAEASAPASGDRGGSCYPNGTCNERLACVDSLCVLFDAGAPGSVDADAPPSAIDASSDAEPDPCESGAAPAIAGEVQCSDTGKTCAGHCCNANPGEWRCGGGGGGCPGAALRCDGNSDCSGSDKCCLELRDMLLTPRCGVPVLSSVCKPNLSVNGGGCDGAFTCTNDTDCAAAKRCETIGAVLNGTRTVVGFKICVPRP